MANPSLFLVGAAAVATIGALLFSRTARGDTVNNTPTNTPTDAPRGSSPLGLRNNNPFNLEFRNIGWVGEIGTDGRFSIFDTAEHGIRAGMININTKIQRDGADTVRELLTLLSPAFENPLEAFISFTSTRLGVAPDQPITFKGQIIPLSKAIIQFENGQQPFTDDQLMAALQSTGLV